MYMNMHKTLFGLCFSESIRRIGEAPSSAAGARLRGAQDLRVSDWRDARILPGVRSCSPLDIDLFRTSANVIGATLRSPVLVPRGTCGPAGQRAVHRRSARSRPAGNSAVSPDR